MYQILKDHFASFVDEFLTIVEKTAKALEGNPMMRQMNNANILAQSGSFPVQTISNITDGASTTTLKKIEKQSFGKDLFMAPAGYTLKEMPEFPGQMPRGQ